MNKEIIIIGAGGHGKVIADIAEKNGYTYIAFLDDRTSEQLCGSYPIIGVSGDFTKHCEKDFFVAIGNAQVRRRIQEQLEASGIKIATLIHPAATVASDVVLDSGTAVMAGAVINPGAKTGKGCIINTCSSVDHDCVLGDYVHVSVGAHVAGTVAIGDGTWIGAGATVSNNVNITGDCMIGAGAVVVHDITEAGTYIGVPARKKD